MNQGIHEDTLQFLYRLRRFGKKPGLEITRQLAQFAGNPEKDLRFIHVAGTNGKGSTCAMLEAIYRQSGLLVGLYTSPHLTTFGERIQVNRTFISPNDTTRLVNQLKPFLQQAPPDGDPSFFELVTVVALLYFREQKCDLVIWETGLGGNFDSTNIVTPIASLITQVDFDHQQWLGDTLAKIAGEKAGIIKKGIPVVTSATNPEALAVIQQTAASLDAPLHQVTPSDLQQPPLNTITLPLPGPHQKTNAALAIKTVQILQDQLPITPAQLQTGLEQFKWAGRGEIVTGPNHKPILLDGAHNCSAVTSLVETVRNQFPNHLPTLIIGMFQDKQIPEVSKILAPLSNTIFTVPIESGRSANPSDLARLFSAANPNAKVQPCDSLASALDHTRTADLLIITGSLHLVGQARDLLKLTPNGHPNERGLNDWTPKQTGS